MGRRKIMPGAVVDNKAPNIRLNKKVYAIFNDRYGASGPERGLR